LVNGFNQKWYIPQGTSGPSGRILIGDTDRDGNLEFIFTTYGSWPAYIHFYELHLPDTWEVDSVLTPGGDLLWDSGDFDGDGLYDLALQFHIENPSLADGIMIYESPDSFSYPTEQVWRDTVDIGTVQPICSYDIDKDGVPEIVQTGGEAIARYYIDFSIYESIGDNSYTVKYYFESPESPTSTIAFGDFDNDSFNEFVIGTISGQYSIFESPGNDSFLPLFVNVQLPTANIKDCFAVPDADGDGKDEFVVKGFTFPDGRIQVFIFEAIGDNSYEIIDTLTFTGFSNSYYGGYSDVGDVDGDEKPEIALEGSYRVYVIKADSNNSFSVFDTLPGHGSGSSVAIYDIDGNGLSEIVISGNNETRIYEYVEEGIKEVKNSNINLKNVKLTIHPNPFTDKAVIEFWASGVQGFNSQLLNSSTPQLTIYDVSGRLVKNFILYPSSFILPAKLVWDGKDSEGKRVKSGIYFLRIENLDSKEILSRKFIKID